MAKLDRGDVDGAMEDIRLQFRVFRASGAGLFTISQLVQIAIGGITVDNCAPLVAAGADFLSVVAGVWSYTDGPAAAVRDFNKIIDGVT